MNKSVIFMKKRKVIIAGVIFAIIIVGISTWNNYINTRESIPEIQINKYYNNLVQGKYKNNLKMLEGKEFKGDLNDFSEYIAGLNRKKFREYQITKTNNIDAETISYIVNARYVEKNEEKESKDRIILSRQNNNWMIKEFESIIR